MPKLSDRVVAALTCPDGRRDALFFDGELAGFGLRVTANGSRTFLLQYRAGAKVRRMVLGRFGSELTTKQARTLAQIRLGEVRSGRDPVGERRSARADAAATEAETKRKATEAAFTLGRLVDQWADLHLAGKRLSYRRDAIGRLRRHLAGMLERPAASITRQEAVRELDRIAKERGETTARRVMGYARSAYAWTRKRGAIEVNPFDGLPAIGSEVRRDRVLTLDEVHAIWAAADHLPPVHAAFVRILMLTLGRRDEVASMRWGEVSKDLSTWTLPQERAKNGRAHAVHLVPAARRILKNVPRLDGDDLIFAAGPGKKLTTFSWMAAVLTERSGVTGWRMHDFRRTGVTVLAGQGVPPHVCDRLLNHVTGAIQGVAAIYQRAEFAGERKAALEAWGRIVAAAPPR